MMVGGLGLALAIAAGPAASQDRPAADPADVESIDAIIEAVYASISGPAGPRDWDRFHSLFLPGAILMNAGPRPDTVPGPSPQPPEGFSGSAGPYFMENAFYEVESSRELQRFGTVAHAWSTYESRRDPSEDPFSRGINSIQLIWHEGRWWVTSIVWDFERPDNPIPAEYGG